MVLSSAWCQISIPRKNSFKNESPQEKHQKVGEGSSSPSKCLPWPLGYPLKNTDQKSITVAIFTGEIPLELTRYVTCYLCAIADLHISASSCNYFDF